MTYFIGYTCSLPLINSRLVLAVALDMQWLAWNNLLFRAWFCLWLDNAISCFSILCHSHVVAISSFVLIFLTCLPYPVLCVWFLSLMLLSCRCLLLMEEWLCRSVTHSAWFSFSSDLQLLICKIDWVETLFALWSYEEMLPKCCEIKIQVSFGRI